MDLLSLFLHRQARRAMTREAVVIGLGTEGVRKHQEQNRQQNTVTGRFHKPCFSLFARLLSPPLGAARGIDYLYANSIA
jgi:hypothetical protein